MWIAARGPSNESGHRRALIPTEGRAYIAQRFAIDFMRVGMDRRVTPDNHGSKNESWYGYGNEVYAVANATVVRIMDSLPDNIPLSSDRVVPVNAETVGGNYVILKLQEGLYAFYAHLKPNSIRVKIGQKVRKGQVIGLLGNSGNSDAPHLHFHLASAPSPLGAEGIPFLFKSYSVLGIEAFDPKSKSLGNKRSRELPLENEIIRFK
jgi:murein DD-endopeptidase MepM/ murein hydrolase activator NlpD